MSYEYNIFEKKRKYAFVIPDVNSKISDDEELQRLYKNSKFLNKEMLPGNKAKEPWVFISHSNKDFTSVRLLRNTLEEEGLRPLLLFLKCMDDEEELDSLIKREIESRTNFILCDSKNAKASKWVQKEVLYIKSLGRNIEKINVDDLCGNINESKAFAHQFAKRTRIILSFDKEHEGMACKMYSRFIKYDIKVFLNPLYDFDGDEFYDCVTDNFSSLIEKGIVVVIVGNWISDINNPITQELLMALDKNKTIEKTYLMPIVLENRINDLITQDIIKDYFKDQYYSFVTIDAYDRVNDAVNLVLTRIMTPSSMFVYVESFRNKAGDKLDYEEASRLTTLLLKMAQSDNAGDLTAIGRCYERGWGCEIDLAKALEYYSKAQKVAGLSEYYDDIYRIEQRMKDTQPVRKMSFWKKLIALLKLYFWPF